MKNLKHISAVIAAAIAAVSIAGCGVPAGNRNPSYYPTEEELTSAASVLSDKFGKGDIVIDGVKYTLPAKAEEFINNGWSFSQEVLDKYDPFPANATLTGQVELQKATDTKTMKFTVDLFNNDKKNELPIGEIYVTDITVTCYDKVKVILPGGVSWGSTVEEVKAACGEPASDTEVGSADTFINKSLSYKFEDGGLCAELMFQSEKGSDFTLTKIIYEGFVESKR